MRRLPTRVAIAAAMLLHASIGYAQPAQALRVPPTAALPTELAVSILTYRASYIERATPIDACSLVRVMSAREDFPGKFPPWLRSLFDRQDSDPCSPSVPVTLPDGSMPVKAMVSFEPTVNVDSAHVVRLAVRKGENVHREDYTVRKRPDAAGWGVTEVRIWGAARVYFVSP